MSDHIAIKVDNVSKTFKLPHEKNNSIKGAVLNFYKRKRTFEKQQVLQDISFEIKQGEFFGIVGRNGSGKSTLLKMLAGTYVPTKGGINVNGKLTPFIELGVGFNPELTGRENVFLNGALLGFNRSEMRAMYSDIVEFAELDRFMDQKLKNYSSGMQVRLAFSIAIRAQSDILILDEVLAVGDASFQQKCFDYFYELKKSNTTVVLVSHDKTALERFCDKGVLIENGEIISSGPIAPVLQAYSKIVLDNLATAEDKALDETRSSKKIDKKNQTSIENTETYDHQGKPRNKFSYGERVGVRFQVNFNEEIKNPILGLTVWEKTLQKPVFATNTLIDSNSYEGIYKKGDKLNFSLLLPEYLNDGEYHVEPAIADESGAITIDKLTNATTFFVVGSSNPYAILSSKDHISLEKK